MREDFKRQHITYSMVYGNTNLVTPTKGKKFAFSRLLNILWGYNFVAFNIQHIYNLSVRISKFTDLSLRVLMYLGHEENDSIVNINEIAVQFKVPRNHLIKVVTKLNKFGWIHATRGRSGGLRIAKMPKELKLGDIILALEHDSIVDCNKPICPIRGECNLKNILDIGLKSFYAEMNKYSLLDILDIKTQIAVIALHKSV